VEIESVAAHEEVPEEQAAGKTVKEYWKSSMGTGI
jgi:hypothetical protein